MARSLLPTVGMTEPVELILFLSGAFVISAGLGYLLAGRKRPEPVRPALGATLRLRGTGGLYRAKLLGFDEGSWRISCPLSRNNYVPLRVDDPLTIEAPVENGVLIFRTNVSKRDEEAHEFLIDGPADIRVTDRRTEKRRPVDLAVAVEGEEGRLVDLSPIGARLVTNRPCHIGERIRLDLEGAMVYGWVLDFWPQRGSEFRESVRVRFEAMLEI